MELILFLLLMENTLKLHWDILEKLALKWGLGTWAQTSSQATEVNKALYYNIYIRLFKFCCYSKWFLSLIDPVWSKTCLDITVCLDLLYAVQQFSSDGTESIHGRENSDGSENSKYFRNTHYTGGINSMENSDEKGRVMCVWDAVTSWQFRVHKAVAFPRA